MRIGPRDEGSYTITDARSPMSKDIAYRRRRYLITMGVRTAGLIIAVVAPIPLAAKIVALIAAIVLPYIAVVFANGGREPERRGRFGSPEPSRQQQREMEGEHHELGG